MKQTFYFSIVLFSISILIRLSILYYFNRILFVSDSSSYLINTYKFFSGETYLFDMRPPGYSYFIYLIWSLFQKSYFALVTAHFVLISLAYSTLYFAIAFLYKTKGFFLPIFILIISLIPVFMLDDYIVYSESLSYALFLLTISFFILSLMHEKPAYYIVLGILIALSIMTKIAMLPLLLFPIILYVRHYLKYKKVFQIKILYALAPVIVAIGALSLYNKKSIHTYSITKFGDFAKLMTVIFWVDEDCTNVEYEKKAIAFMNTKISENDRNEIRNNCTIGNVSPSRYSIYTKNCENIWHYYNYLIDSCAYSQIDVYNSTGNIHNKAKQRAGSKILNHQANMLYGFLYSLKTCKFSLYPLFNSVGSHEIFKKDLFSIHYQKPEFQALLKLKLEKPNSNFIIDKLFLFISIAFRNLLWYVIFLIALFASLYVILKEKQVRDIHVFFLGLSLFLFCYASMLVYYAHADTIRYTYFTSIILYLGLFHTIFLFKETSLKLPWKK
jgi:Dolichyl-phosphate-mannose-protein mannosyltransferase